MLAIWLADTNRFLASATSGAAMLADRSTRIVNRGLPGGGGMRSIHVGLSRSASGNRKPADISVMIAAQRRRDIADGRRQAYQTTSAPAANASTSQRAGDTKG